MQLTTPSRANRPTKARQTARPWAVTANALLLLLGAGAAAYMAAYLLGALGAQWPLTAEVWHAQRGQVIVGFIFGLLAALALAAALGFMRLARGAWLLAVLVQGIALGLALVVYFASRPAYVYGLMVYGIVMVLYLHQADVQAAFRPDEPPGETGEPA